MVIGLLLGLGLALQFLIHERDRLAFDLLGITPPSLRGAPGFWAAATVGLTLAAIGLGSFLAWMLREVSGHHRTPPVGTRKSAS